jgi:hypothetical protein
MRFTHPNDVNLEGEEFQCVLAVRADDENFGASWQSRDGPVQQVETLNAVMAGEPTKGRHKDLAD